MVKAKIIKRADTFTVPALNFIKSKSFTGQQYLKMNKFRKRRFLTTVEMKLKGGLVKRVRPLFKTGGRRHEKRLHDCEALGVSALAGLVPRRAGLFPLWASLFPLHVSDPAGIQTLDLQNRNLTLYSAKLRGREALLPGMRRKADAKLRFSVEIGKACGDKMATLALSM